MAYAPLLRDVDELTNDDDKVGNVCVRLPDMPLDWEDVVEGVEVDDEYTGFAEFPK